MRLLLEFDDKKLYTDSNDVITTSSKFTLYGKTADAFNWPYTYWQQLQSYQDKNTTSLLVTLLSKAGIK